MTGWPLYTVRHAHTIIIHTHVCKHMRGRYFRLLRQPRKGKRRTTKSWKTIMIKGRKNVLPLDFDLQTEYDDLTQPSRRECLRVRPIKNSRETLLGISIIVVQVAFGSFSETHHVILVRLEYSISFQVFYVLSRSCVVTHVCFVKKSFIVLSNYYSWRELTHPLTQVSRIPNPW